MAVRFEAALGAPALDPLEVRCVVTSERSVDTGLMAVMMSCAILKNPPSMSTGNGSAAGPGADDGAPELPELSGLVWLTGKTRACRCRWPPRETALAAKEEPVEDGRERSISGHASGVVCRRPAGRAGESLIARGEPLAS